MRSVGLTDLDLAARAVMSVPPDAQMRAARDLIAQAHVCDLWRKRTGLAHPSGGTGSLYAQAALSAVAQPKGACPTYCTALRCVLEALEDWRGRADQHP